MNDIYASVPMYDDDDDTWELYHYWVHDDGGITLSDSSGNHEWLGQEDPTTGELVEGEPLPTAGQLDEAWLAYFKWVANSGKDPLGEMTDVKRTRAQQAGEEIWQIDARGGIAGPMIAGARKNSKGPWIRASALPAYVQDYLLLRPVDAKPGSPVSGRMYQDEWKTLDDFVSDTAATGAEGALNAIRGHAGTVKWGRRGRFGLTRKGVLVIPRPASEPSTKATREAARGHVARLKAKAKRQVERMQAANRSGQPRRGRR